MKDSYEERSEGIQEVTKEFFYEEIVKNNIVAQVEERPPVEIIGNASEKVVETSTDPNTLQ